MLKRNYKFGKDRLLAKAQAFVSEYFDDFGLIQLTDWKQDALWHKFINGEVERVFENDVWVERMKNGSPLPTGYEIQLCLPLIRSVEAWKNNILAAYLLVHKPRLIDNPVYDYDYTKFGQPPVSFTDIFLAITPHLRPSGWEIPDVTDYIPITPVDL
jgi:hypothetical protein